MPAGGIWRTALIAAPSADLAAVPAAAALVRHAHAFAGDAPLIIAGDFNATPDDDCYKIVTRQPVDRLGAARDCCIATPLVLQSAHVTANGREPAHTTHAYINKGGAPSEFIAVVDYIFHSSHFVHAMARPMSDEPGPYPTAREPSDHLVVGATLRTAPPDDGPT